MSDPQTTFFPAPAAKESKRKAKALPKVRARDAPAEPLPPAAAAARDKALASVRSARARARVGDLRISDWPCSQCGGERVEEIVSIAKEGGVTWDVICLKCHHG